jgi:hypothetical protein
MIAKNNTATMKSAKLSDNPSLSSHLQVNIWDALSLQDAKRY